MTDQHWAYWAAEQLRPLVENVKAGHHLWERQHLHHMIDQIAQRRMSPTKACRWLGWIQACLCFSRSTTIDEMKELNRAASEAFMGQPPGRLTKPAQVGNTSFGTGVPERAVIERAQREYEYYRGNVNQEAVRISRANRAVRAFHLEGALAELVELKGIKEAIERGGPDLEMDDLKTEYAARKERAWRRAREVLQGFGEEPSNG